jgi:hypothetical protein
MRIGKFLIPSLTAVALVAGSFAAPVAVGDDLVTVAAPLPVQDFLCVDNNESTISLCVVAGPEIAGRQCTITANGTILVSLILAEGANVVTLPQMGPMTYVAAGEGLEARPLQGGWGIN